MSGVFLFEDARLLLTHSRGAGTGLTASSAVAAARRPHVPHTRFLCTAGHGLLHWALGSSAARPAGATLRGRTASDSATGSKMWNCVVHKEAPHTRNGRCQAGQPRGEGARGVSRAPRFGGYRYILASQQGHRNGVHDRRTGLMPLPDGKRWCLFPHTSLPLPSPRITPAPLRAPVTLPPHTSPSLLPLPGFS